MANYANLNKDCTKPKIIHNVVKNELTNSVVDLLIYQFFLHNYIKPDLSYNSYEKL